MDQQLELLDFLYNQQYNVIFEPQRYSNQITIAFAVALIPRNLENVFPIMRLHVARIDDSILEEAKSKMKFIIDRLSEEHSDYKDIWITTSNIKDRHLAMVEISFE
ncbi:hypothetical protein RD055328_08810 [Companilactobacillus sp. RD055328]|uniref:hypothetical protein n=1 Tax=Companilactobacillus sp. RD055328 TaxID=2916634 RepID=UPI001FC855A9|nr:hypothetical protein [Companilactobacillus sp. RD055328]GKQ42958.1 hypothetical protein RD055328_08810 [Companilactobacillus sp. RD055328]